MSAGSPSKRSCPREGLTLLEMPNDVVRLICAQLCSHCCGPSLTELLANDRDEGLARDEDARSLQALSRTCTALRDITQPLLYHMPWWHMASLSRFLRTIQERPDLADAVRYLPSIRLRQSDIGIDFIPDGFGLVKEMAGQLHMFGLQDTPFEDEFSALIAHPTEGKDFTDPSEDDIRRFAMLLYGMLIALLPRIELLQVNADPSHYHPPGLYHHMMRRLQRTGTLVSSRCTGLSIATLHTIVVDDWRANPYAWDEQNTFDGNSMVHLDPHEFLLSCASSLKHLVFNSCDAPYEWPAVSRGTNPTSIWSRLPDLRSVVFHNMAWGVCNVLAEPELDSPVTDEQQNVAYARIEQIATECTSLSSFAMSVVPLDRGALPNTFSPRRLAESLLPAASRLESLTIHPNMVRLRHATEVLLDAGMRRFTKLQYLSVNEECFCRHRIYDRHYDPNIGVYHRGNSEAAPPVPYEDEYPQIRTDNECLVSVLPSSIKYLTVRLRGRFQAIPDLIRLGRATVDGQFPNLKQLVVHPAMDGLKAKLADAFEGSGVVVQVMGYD